MAEKPFARIGGRDVIFRIVSNFYDRVFADPILSQFFVDVRQEQQVNQFTDFMTQVLGGPKMYLGREPKDAHPHLFIEKEHFDMRHELLRQTLEDERIAVDIRDLWLGIDNSFANVIVKKSIDECSKRFNSDQIITVWSQKAS